MVVVYFDCETTGLEKDCSIVCAATYKVGDSEPRAWHETPAKRLSETRAAELATYLLGADDSNVVATFNGLSFDLPVLVRHLAPGSRLRRKLAKLAVFRHKDLCYDFLTSTGYCTSLKSFLACTSFQQKQMTGADAAQLVSEIVFNTFKNVGRSPKKTCHIFYSFFYTLAVDNPF